MAQATSSAAATPASKPPPAQAAAGAAQKVASRLGLVRGGKIATPTTYVIYGGEGVGKTTLAANAPGVIMADIEDGSSELDVARYVFNDHPERGHVPTSYEDVLAMVEDLTVSDHPFRTLAIDSLDRLESLIWRWMLARDSQASAKNKKGEELNGIEDYGYGKGYQYAVDEWRSFCAKLDRLRYARKMEIVLVGHGLVKTFKNPLGEDYDRWQLRINEKAASFLKEWAKVTGFMQLEEDAKKLSKYGRPKGFSTGLRVIKLARSAAVDAKSRLALPDEVVVDVENPWLPFAEAVAAAHGIDVKQLAAEIEGEFKRINDPARADRARPLVAEALRKADAGKLQRFLNDLRKQEARPAEEVQS